MTGKISHGLPRKRSVARVLQIDPPVNGGALYSGIAVSGRGRRYSFCASKRDRYFKVMREDPVSFSGTFGNLWWYAPNADICCDCDPRGIEGHRLNTIGAGSRGPALATCARAGWTPVRPVHLFVD